LTRLESTGIPQQNEGPALSEHRYLVPPDIDVAVRARANPKLLSYVLGDETLAAGVPSLVLDLTGQGNFPTRHKASGRYKGSRWQCVFSSEGGGSLLAFQSAFAREYLALHIALLPALRRLLLDRGVAFVGAAAFESNGGATVLAGVTGSGKTSLLLGALERGAAFIGDEYLGLGETGRATPIVRAIALRQETLALAPTIAGRLSQARRRALRVSSLARRLTARRLEPLVHLPPAEAGVRLASAQAVPIRRLVWIEPASDAAPRLEPMAVADIIDRLAIMQTMHDKAYRDLGAAFDEVRGKDADYRPRWRAVLEHGLRDVACSRLVTPSPSTAALELVL
jgi:hypothetical protein